jgi:hypothetical protein
MYLKQPKAGICAESASKKAAEYKFSDTFEMNILAFDKLPLAKASGNLSHINTTLQLLHSSLGQELGAVFAPPLVRFTLLRTCRAVFHWASLTALS